MNGIIQKCRKENLMRYGEIYARAFSGEPWNHAWKTADAVIHIKELLGSARSYGLEYIREGKVIGFILGTSMMFHYGRVFEIHDLAVDPAFQKQGIGAALLERCLRDIQNMGMTGVHLITESQGALPDFYARYGFKKEEQVMLMGKEL